ncbi:MAG: HEAT repeat domain-containing protein [Thermodesulfobacteriota bacterium]
MAESFHSKDEDVSSLAASELARLRTEVAKKTLIENLNNDIYHVRKSAAVALGEDFGDEGLEILKDHILSHEEPFYRATSAQGLASTGETGVNMLFDIMRTEKPGPVFSAVEALTGVEDELNESLIPMTIEALMQAGDRRDIPLVVEILRLLALFKDKALRYEAFITAFADDNSESIRMEAQKTLHEIRRGR